MLRTHKYLTKSISRKARKELALAAFRPLTPCQFSFLNLFTYQQLTLRFTCYKGTKVYATQNLALFCSFFVKK